MINMHINNYRTTAVRDSPFIKKIGERHRKGLSSVIIVTYYVLVMCFCMISGLRFCLQSFPVVILCNVIKKSLFSILYLDLLRFTYMISPKNIFCFIFMFISFRRKKKKGLELYPFLNI